MTSASRSPDALREDTAPGPTDVPLLEVAERLVRVATQRGLSIGAAESCTGGLVSAAITSVPGASACFAGAVVSYADRVKAALLDVPDVALDLHGAVSAQVAMAMAAGARSRLDCDVAVAVTGIAGPDGGTPAKPVGLTYIAVETAAGHEVMRHTWSGDRTQNQRRSAVAALEALVVAIERAALLRETSPPETSPPESRERPDPPSETHT